MSPAAQVTIMSGSWPATSTMQSAQLFQSPAQYEFQNHLPAANCFQTAVHTTYAAKAMYMNMSSEPDQLCKAITMDTNCWYCSSFFLPVNMCFFFSRLILI